MNSIVSIHELSKEPYASVVCYPRTNTTELENRKKELECLSIEKIEFAGKASAFTLPVLGKGYVGIVVTAIIRDKKYALKMQRVDSDRESLQYEADLLAKANLVGVGPKYRGVTKHFLLMELINGSLLEEWLLTGKDKVAVQTILMNVLEQCWRLDEIHLDHGELSKAPKHLLVDRSNKPFIVDFETASTRRNASNVTSVCQFLFQGNSQVCKLIADIIGERNKPDFIAALRKYRKERNRENFEALKNVCFFDYSGNDFL